ncbi:MAG: nitrogenase cofactor biosynthesis protein NifB [Spirochaetaceae bacterium]|jgi:nitrogenase cofactor biosynthesis protein NifB|nr:nitrogenase cofactor biosynthesis protein NifB [Spirochaetaceae bacterium]
MKYDRKTAGHPCFAEGSCGKGYGRIHLPVAPACNMQCNYCRRSFDCVNESRPGVTSKVINPAEALERYRLIKEKTPCITVAGIAGPGDALANIERTIETLRLIRGEDAEVLFCISTNGLLLPRYAEDLRNAGVSHITVTVNAADAETAKRIYRYIDYEGKRYIREEAAEILLHNQIEGIQKAAGLGLACKVNIVLIRGLNDGQIPRLVQKVKDAGALLTNIMQLIPVRHTLFETLPMVSREELDKIRKTCEAILPQMYHCRQCRSDAAGPLDNDMSYLFAESPAPGNTDIAAHTKDAKEDAAAAGFSQKKGTLFFAVASKTGVMVDEHFGHVSVFFIYEYTGGKIRFVEKRAVPRYCHPPEPGRPAGEVSFRDNCGSHTGKIERIISAVAGCSAVLVMRIGEVPRMELAEKGIRVFLAYDYIEEAVRKAAGTIGR